jgi:hypothetical protein
VGCRLCFMGESHRGPDGAQKRLVVGLDSVAQRPIGGIRAGCHCSAVAKGRAEKEKFPLLKFKRRRRRGRRRRGDHTDALPSPPPRSPPAGHRVLLSLGAAGHTKLCSPSSSSSRFPAGGEQWSAEIDLPGLGSSSSSSVRVTSP